MNMLEEIRDRFDRFLVRIGLAEEEYQTDDRPVEKNIKSKSTISANRVKSDKMSYNRQDNVTSIYGSDNPEITMIMPEKFNDVHNITLELKAGKAVIVNMETIDIALSLRIRDFLYGLADMSDGTYKIISDHIVIVAPVHFDVSIDTRKITGGFDTHFRSGGVTNQTEPEFLRKMMSKVV